MEVANRTNTDRLFGLLTFRGAIETDRDPAEATLNVRMGASEAALPGADITVQESPATWAIQFNVNSHLIGNGDQTLQGELRWRDGFVAKLPARQYRIDNTGALANAVRRDLKAFGTPAIFGRVVDSGLFPYGTGEKAWFEQEPPPDVPLSLASAHSTEAAEEHLLRWGFCLLPQRLPKDLIDGFWNRLEAAIDSGAITYQRGSSDRIRQAHLLPEGREIWLFPPVLDFLRGHFRDEPCACQTLTYPHGSEQQPHQDTVHLTPYPGGYMCGVWIALQDVQPNSGELVVYPGSHLFRRLRARELGLAKVDKDYSSYVAFDAAIRALVSEHGSEPVVYRPKAGEILVWHENLIHGGSPRRNRELTRKSIVSHYFARGCVAYYDSRGEAAWLEALQ
jgi:hypothetical protein